MGFEEFVAERLDGLLRYATVLTNDPHLAQDIVQDVLLRAQQRWDGIAAPPTYVRRMVTNEYLSWRRRAVRRMVPSSHDVLDALSSPSADPATAYDERDAMLGLLATLPRKQRAARKIDSSAVHRSFRGEKKHRHQRAHPGRQRHRQ